MNNYYLCNGNIPEIAPELSCTRVGFANTGYGVYIYCDDRFVNNGYGSQPIYLVEDIPDDVMIILKLRGVKMKEIRRLIPHPDYSITFPDRFAYLISAATNAYFREK